MKKQVLVFLSGLFMVAMSACSSDAPATDTVTTVTDPATTVTKTDATVPAVTPAIAMATTALSFDKTTHDFGGITDGGPVETVFVLTNTGNEPLVISEAKGSCGCTVPEYPTDPVAPGETREIKVSFNPSGKEGAQNKTVTILANTEPQSTVLNIKASVTKTTPVVQ